METFLVGSGRTARIESIIRNISASRLLLLSGCILAMGLALRQGHPAAYLQSDPALARLLRGMAAIKGLAVWGAVAVVYWRLGWRTAPLVAVAYLSCVWVLAGATALIWQLTFIPAAAVLFHMALIGLLLAAWRDDNKRPLR